VSPKGLFCAAVPGVALAAATTNAPALVRGLQDIRGPIDLSVIPPWIVRSLLVAIPLVLLAVAWWRRRRRNRTEPERIRETAAARARARLSESWTLLDQPDRFCTLLSEIARVYVEERFGLRAPDRTTEEFLADLQDRLELGPVHRRLLEDFLTQCDIVKFARGEPGRLELERLHQLASKLVDDTGAELPPLHEAVGAKGGAA